MDLDNNRQLSDSEIMDYLEGNMTGHNRRELERKAVRSGEMHDLYSMRKAVYQAYSGQADELLGRDYSQADMMDQVFQDAKELLSSKPSHVSMTEYLKAYLENQLDYSVTEAERVLGQIVGGVDIYYSSFDRQVSEDADSPLCAIDSAMEDMPASQMVDYLINVLVLLLTFNGKVTRESIDSVKEHIESYSLETEDTDELIDRLRKRIGSELEEAVFPGSIINEDNLKRLKDDFTIKTILDARRLDKEYAIYSAVCAYVAQCKGEIDLVDTAGDEDIHPVAIGIGVAAGVKQSELTQQYLSGEMEESRFLTFLKIAATVAAFALAIYLAIHFAGPVLGSILQYLALDPTLGFWWNLLDVAMLVMFFASLSLNVLLQGAFIAAVFNLVIETVSEWIASKRETAVGYVTSAPEQVTQGPSETVASESDQDISLSSGTESPAIEL